jgi:hypothetical protein
MYEVEYKNDGRPTDTCLQEKMEELLGVLNLSESTLVFYSLWRSIITTSHYNSLRMKYMR